MFSRVTEAMHFMSHALHALSDGVINYNQVKEIPLFCYFCKYTFKFLLFLFLKSFLLQKVLLFCNKAVKIVNKK